VSLRVGVTGSSGFIGGHVLDHMRSRGHAPVPIRRPFEAAALTSTFRGLDVVVHLAGVVSAARARDFHEGNVVATQIVAQAARDAGVPIVHISSLAAAGPAPRSSPRVEGDPPRPINVYGRTKLAGEAIVRDLSGLRWTILRPGVVYGPGDRALRPLFRYTQRGLLPLVGSPSAAYTFIHVDDAVRAIGAAVERDAGGETIFLGHAEPVTARGLLEAIAQTMGMQPRVIGVPRAVVRLAALAGDAAAVVTGRPAAINTRRFAELYAEGFVCRVDRMTERLGVRADIGLADGLARARPWYVGRAL
jgi:nucleoside-diphosphate-sugar epimerase